MRRKRRKRRGQGFLSVNTSEAVEFRNMTNKIRSQNLKTFGREKTRGVSAAMEGTDFLNFVVKNFTHIVWKRGSVCVAEEKNQSG